MYKESIASSSPLSHICLAAEIIHDGMDKSVLVGEVQYENMIPSGKWYENARMIYIFFDMSNANMLLQCEGCNHGNMAVMHRWYYEF